MALLQPIQAGEDGCEYQSFKGMGLELSLFIAHLTGSALYTDCPSDWRQLHEHTSAVDVEGLGSHLDLISNKLSSLVFPVEANPRINCEIRRSGRLGRIRRIFRRIWTTAMAQNSGSDTTETVQKLAEDLDRACARTVHEWDKPFDSVGRSERYNQRFEVSAPRSGFNMQSVHRLLIATGHTNYIESIPLALFSRRSDCNL